MAVKLPDDGYGAMVFINWLANEGYIGEVGWTLRDEGDQTVLVEIKAQLCQRVVVDKPPAVLGPRGLMIVKGPAANAAGLRTGKHKF